MFVRTEMSARRHQLVFSDTSNLSTIPENYPSKPAFKVDDKNQVIVSPKTGAFFALIVLLSFVFVMSVACTAMLGVNIGMQNSLSDRVDEILNKIS